jgi:hypothetical protein
MTCRWLHLSSLTTEEHLCGEPGKPYCPEHKAEMDYIHGLDDNWKEVEAKGEKDKGRKR